MENYKKNKKKGNSLQNWVRVRKSITWRYSTLRLHPKM